MSAPTAQGVTPVVLSDDEAAHAAETSSRRTARGRGRHDSALDCRCEAAFQRFTGRGVGLDDGSERSGDLAYDLQLPDGRRVAVVAVDGADPGNRPLLIAEAVLEAGRADLFAFVEDEEDGTQAVLGYIHRDRVPGAAGDPNAGWYTVPRASLRPAVELSSGDFRRRGA